MDTSLIRRRALCALAFTLALIIEVGAAGDLPDPERTPGKNNPDVTQGTIRTTICKANWTKTIRPDSNFMRKVKVKQLELWGYPDRTTGHYQEDHLISLQLGGHPRDEKNLWPQPYTGSCNARVKDVLETKLKRLVCSNQMTLAEARRLIKTNWITAYKKYVDTGGCRPIRARDEPDRDDDD